MQATPGTLLYSNDTMHTTDARRLFTASTTADEHNGI